mmetsp:Transcript_5847/g.13054  ORF Transcript_5847/g.13054 Transcript_5847/m.13054 type:complete len:332 (-) Transcript_5847:1178-2173(-)
MVPPHAALLYSCQAIFADAETRGGPATEGRSDRLWPLLGRERSPESILGSVLGTLTRPLSCFRGGLERVMPTLASSLLISCALFWDSIRSLPSWLSCRSRSSISLWTSAARASAVSAFLLCSLTWIADWALSAFSRATSASAALKIDSSTRPSRDCKASSIPSSLKASPPRRQANVTSVSRRSCRDVASSSPRLRPRSRWRRRVRSLPLRCCHAVASMARARFSPWSRSKALLALCLAFDLLQASAQPSTDNSSKPVVFLPIIRAALFMLAAFAFSAFMRHLACLDHSTKQNSVVAESELATMRRAVWWLRALRCLVAEDSSECCLKAPKT